MLNKPIVDSLRKALKGKGLTYKDLAKQLNLSESSIKRLFSEGTFTLERFMEVCNATGISLLDLAKITENDTAAQFHEYTPEQEEFFVKNLKCLAYFDQLLILGNPGRVAQAHSISKKQTVEFLSNLEKIKLIEWLPNDRVKFLTPKEVVWRKNGKLRNFLLELAKNEFLLSTFESELEFFKFSIADLSETNIKRFRIKLEDLIRDFSRESSFDRQHREKTKKVGMMIGMRPWNLSVLEKIKS